MLRKLVAVALILVFTLLVLAIHETQSQAMESRMYAEMGEKLLYLPSGKLIKQASLGMDAALASLLWVRAVIYFGSHYTTDKDYRWLAHTLDVATTLDPGFLRAYRIGGLLLSLEANHVDDSIKLLQKGIQHNPEDWSLRAAQGFNYFYFKDDPEKAAEYFHQAAELPGTPDHVQRLAARMYAQTGKVDVAMDYLASLAEAAKDETVRQALVNRYKELVIEKQKALLEAALQQYGERHGERPQTLEALVSAGIIQQLPPDPHGGQYIINPETGRVESTDEDPQWP